MKLNFLSKEQILNLAKEKLQPEIANYKESLKESIELYIKTKSPNAKSWVISFAMKKINLPWYMKPFKGMIEKKLEKSFDELINIILEKIEEL